MELTIRPFGKVVSIAKGSNVGAAIASAGINLRSDCGGVGRCGKCRVRSKDGLSAPTQAEKKLLGARELRKGVRLACQARISESVEVLIPPTSMESRIKILIEGIPEALRPEPSVTRETFLKPQEQFGKDLSWEAIRPVLKGAADGSPPTPSLHLLKCLAADGDLTNSPLSFISLAGRGLEVEKGEAPRPVLGLAVDIGTTTIVGYLLDLFSGERLAHAARKNPQAKFGEDVVSRIVFATSEPLGLKRLQEAVVKALNDIIREAAQKANAFSEQIFEVSAVGNTTMHHLLLGLNPRNLARFPYTPVIRAGSALPAREVGLAIHPEGQLYLPPLIAGFMGSDTVGVILATRLHESQSIKLAIDFGTNGEVVLGNRDRMVAASCAAGPAFEGSQIRYGMTGSSGAIDEVFVDQESQVHLHTIDDYPPVGICGSGLVDAVAALRRQGIIDGHGRFLSRSEVKPSHLARRLTRLERQAAFLLWQEEGDTHPRRVLLTQRDIRELQLAKSAVTAGIRILMKELGVSPPEVAEVLLAGAFGNYVKPESAMGIGLLPAFDKTLIKPVGNAAGMGAQVALLSVTAREEAEAIARRVEYIELAKHPNFQREFIDGMAFP